MCPEIVSDFVNNLFLPKMGNHCNQPQLKKKQFSFTFTFNFSFTSEFRTTYKLKQESKLKQVSSLRT